MDWAVHNLARSCFGNSLVLSAAMYHIWEDRNARIFSNKAKDWGVLFSGA